MRTKEEILADMEALYKEINPELDKGGDCGSGHFARIALLKIRPDLKKRCDDLMSEGREFEKQEKENQ